jgi:hypothetical protein
MFNKCFVVLQNCMGLLGGVPSSDTETCYERYRFVGTKAGDISDIQDDDHPVKITFPVTKDVQGVCLCLHS